MINIEPTARALMLSDALQTFPNECCGFMFGTEDEEGNRIISEIMVVDNAKEGDKTRRFEISPVDYLKAERHASASDRLLLGIYHSHPRHPAVPSEHDRKAAQPYFSYVIISVHDAENTGIRSWRLNENEQFEEENLGFFQFNLS